MEHLWGTSQAHALSWQMLPAPEFVHLPANFWDCFSCWNLQAMLRNRVRTSPAAAAHTATCQKTGSRRERLRQEESGKGTKNKVCVLRTRLAASRAASPWTVVSLNTCLQFQEHAIFSCGGLAHKAHVQTEIDRHRVKPWCFLCE